MSEPPPDAVVDAPAERYVLRHKPTPTVDRYEVLRADERGRELGLLCFAEHDRSAAGKAAREPVTFFTDEAKAHPIFGLRARRRLDLGTAYDVTDNHGRPIGWLRKHFTPSSLTSTWTLGLPDGRELVGRERSARAAVARLLWEVVPVVGDVPGPFVRRVDFLAADGRPGLTWAKRAGVRDVHRVTLPAMEDGRPIDWRVGMAVAVALDALQPH